MAMFKRVVVWCEKHGSCPLKKQTFQDCPYTGWIKNAKKQKEFDRLGGFSFGCFIVGLFPLYGSVWNAAFPDPEASAFNVYPDPGFFAVPL